MQAKAEFCEDQILSRGHRCRGMKGPSKSQKPSHKNGGARWEQNPQADLVPVFCKQSRPRSGLSKLFQIVLGVQLGSQGVSGGLPCY